MGELPPSPTEPTDTQPDIEQLADWLIAQELPKLQPNSTSEQHTELGDLPETYFDRRSEVKDNSPTESISTKPMTPIAEVLKAKSSKVPTFTQNSKQAVSNKKRATSVYSNPAYASAISKGFYAALIILATILVILLIKSTI